jgi:hypothetical protein
MFRMKLQGRSFEEIREALGVRSINTIYTWDFRCRQKLLEKMGGNGQKVLIHWYLSAIVSRFASFQNVR